MYRKKLLIESTFDMRIRFVCIKIRLEEKLHYKIRKKHTQIMRSFSGTRKNETLHYDVIG